MIKNLRQYMSPHFYFLPAVSKCWSSLPMKPLRSFNRNAIALCLTVGLLLCLLNIATAGELADRWQQEYSNEAATAEHVVGLWQFNSGAELEDSSGHGHTLRLEGAETVSDGRFGGGLRSFPGWPVEDKRHAAVATHHPSLSPGGALTIDMWIKPAADLPTAGNCHLLCKKYVSHNDYQLVLPAGGGIKRPLQLALGFGNESEVFMSESVEWPADVWQHVAVTYDGAGTVRFFRNGATIGGRTASGRKSISPGTLPLTIGDRTGSHYGGFSGVIDQLRISNGVREFSAVSLDIAIARKTYVRMGSAPTVSITVRNLQPAALKGAKLTIKGIGATPTFELPELEAGAEHVVPVVFETTLRPDIYEFTARVEIPETPDSGPRTSYREEKQFITLVARPLPHRMPVMMWGDPADFEEGVHVLKRLGFTQSLGIGVNSSAIWEARQPQPAGRPADIEATIKTLDTALANDFGIGAMLYAGDFLKKLPDINRVDREGKPYERHDCNASLPGLAEFCENVGRSVGKTYGDHPAFLSALVNSEVRDSSEISFSDFDQERYREFSGTDIPEQITSKWGFSWKDVKDLPADRVMPDDHPLLKFYRWHWTIGDGWNNLHTAVHRGLKETAREDIWTWFDPTIRAPSIAGSGGDVDVLSQWTYTEPSSLRVGYFADELFAMAALSSRQQRVMKMTQLFWYRSTSAPLHTGKEFIASPFDDHDPDAAYISIAPMHLRESFWTKISRPVSGLMYHGWSSLVATDGSHAYKHTQPDLETEFARLHTDVLEPLGPTLLQVTDDPTDVAYLESFTSQMFARRGAWGYGQDEAYLTLMHAQLQPRVVYEETIQRHGLDGYRVLVMADCDVLPASVVAKVLEFQEAGGIIIGDPNLAPAVKPDIVIPKFTRTKKPQDDKATLLMNAAALRNALDHRYQRVVETTNPEIIPRRRTAGASDYVFVVNDRREAGTYVGQHGLVQDVGLPGAGHVQLSRDRGYVYSLTQNRRIITTSGDSLTWPVALEPCDGDMFLITDRPIEKVSVDTPETAKIGQSFDCKISVTNADNAIVDAVIPVRVDILDPHGRPAEFTGYYGTQAGQLKLTLSPASNDVPGVWTIRVRELASGIQTASYVRILP
jgi:hypothetical protein